MDLIQSIIKRNKIKKIKKLIDIKVLLKSINLVNKYEIHKSELWSACPNPEHKDNSASWSINIDPESERFGVHSCFSCGYKGNYISLTRDKLSQTTNKEVNNKEALEFIINLFTLDKFDEETIYDLILDEREQLSKIEDENISNLNKIELPEEYRKIKPSAQIYFDYLINERKIKQELISKYKIGYCNEGKYKKRIIIPFYQKDKLISFLGRSILPTIKSEKKNGEEFEVCPSCKKLNTLYIDECIKCDHVLSNYVLKKARSRYPIGSKIEFALWPYDDFDYELDYIILVEGAMDKLRLESLEYKNVFCLFGNKITEHQTKLLIEIEKKLNKKLKVFIFPDADAGGDILISFANQKIKYLFDSYVIELPWNDENPLDPGNASIRQIRIAINKADKLYKVVNKKKIN